MPPGYTYTKDLQNALKYKFEDYQLIERNFSHISQDMFVLTALNGKKNGTYLEIGGNHPIELNNTYLLETVFNWTGVSIEIINNFVAYHNQIRKNPAYQGDALEIDYINLLQQFKLPSIIDYLSMDIDPPINTFSAFKKLPHDKVKFRVITFEHDSYSGEEGQKVRLDSRDYIKGLGYDILINDISWLKSSVEDWYVHPDHVNMDYVNKIRRITENGEHHTDLLYDNYPRE